MTTSPNLFPPPPTYALPVSLGADIQVTFRNMVPGSEPPEYVDYPPEVGVSLVVGKAGAVLAESVAVINGPDAVCDILFPVADTLKAGVPWRCVVTVPDGDESDAVVPVNGLVVRFDGA